ncbi:MAG: DUF4249 family protein [Muribaculaceae bacterium]|nr:DUF4249 family protein [Muribaculaceae bacterium]
MSCHFDFLLFYKYSDFSSYRHNCVCLKIGEYYRTPYSPDGLPFTDEGINGQSHTLVVKEIVQGGYGSHLTRYNEMKRKFKLFSISKDYYEYLLSVLYNDTDSEGLHGGMIDLGISEPMKYFSNIMGGIGIFASYSLDETDLDVIQICGRFPK